MTAGIDRQIRTVTRVGQRLPVVTESMIRFVYDVAHAGVRATDQFHTDWNPLGGGAWLGGNGALSAGADPEVVDGEIRASMTEPPVGSWGKVPGEASPRLHPKSENFLLVTDNFAGNFTHKCSKYEGDGRININL